MREHLYRPLDTDLIAGDCQLANTVIAEESGKLPLHPMQVLARAYGLPDD